jgi:hypothetical protein
MVTTTPDRRTVTVEQAARELGIGRGHAYELPRRGKLLGPCWTDGGSGASITTAPDQERYA